MRGRTRNYRASKREVHPQPTKRSKKGLRLWRTDSNRRYSESKSEALPLGDATELSTHAELAVPIKRGRYGFHEPCSTDAAPIVLVPFNAWPPTCVHWCAPSDSNRQPTVYKTDALTD